MSTYANNNLVIDEGPSFIRYALPGWLTADEVAEIRGEVAALVSRYSVDVIVRELDPVEVQAVAPAASRAVV